MTATNRCLVLFDGVARLGPYGVDRLRDFGYELVEVAPARTCLHLKLRDAAEHRLGIPIDKTLRSAHLVPSVDVVLAFLERQALFPSWLKARGMLPYSKKPLAMLACWLADELRVLPRGERERLASRYRGVDLTMVWSSNQIDILVEAGFRPDSVESISFGFSPELFPYSEPTTTSRHSIVAVGSDRGRDYPTLIQAAADSCIEVDLYCKPENLRGANLPPNVRFRGTVPFEEYRHVLRTAGAVAIPTEELAYPTGQTVALEAAASGAAVIVTGTPAMREYFTEDTALLVPPGDVEAWRDALRTIASDASRRLALAQRGTRHVHSRFQYLEMWRQVHGLFTARGWV